MEKQETYFVYSCNRCLIQSCYNNFKVVFEVWSNGQGNITKHRKNVRFYTSMDSAILRNAK